MLWNIKPERRWRIGGRNFNTHKKKYGRYDIWYGSKEEKMQRKRKEERGKEKEEERFINPYRVGVTFCMGL